MTPIAETAVLVLLACTSLLTGRVVATAFGWQRWRRPTPESLAGATILGAMLWTVGFALLSGLGRRNAREALVVLAGLLVALTLLALRRRGCRRRLQGSPLAWLALTAAVVSTGLLALLPVWLGEGFLAGNDTYAYCAVAEWLQTSGFGQTAPDRLDSPIDALALQYQQIGLRLGGSYPLALARAAGLAGTTLALYPAVSALGLLLCVLALWCASRLLIRVPPAVAVALTLAFALAPHAGYWAHHSGFLAQTLAVPALLLGLVALGSGRGLHGRSGLAAWAVSGAFLCFVYLPFLPLLAAATLVTLAGDFVDDRRPGLVIVKRLVLATLVLAVLIGGDVSFVYKKTLTFLQETRAGAHVPLSPLGMAAIALGTGPGAAVGVPRSIAPAAAALTLAAALLAVSGVLALRRQRRARGLLTVVVSLVGLAAWLAWFSRDPWTGARGHTWSLFKAAQYALPPLLLMQAAGLAWLRRLAVRLEALVVTVALALAPAHLPWAMALGGGLAFLAGGSRPLRELDRIQRNLGALPPGQLLFLGLPAAVSQFRGGYAALLAWPRAVSADWEGSASIPSAGAPGRAFHERLIARIGEPGIVPVLIDAPPFDTEGRQDLGGGFSRLLDTNRPRLLQVTPPLYLRVRQDLPASWATAPRTKLLLLNASPEPVRVLLEVKVPPRTSYLHPELRVIPGTLTGTEFRRAARETPPRRIELHPQAPARLVLDARTGLTTLVFSAEGRAVWFERLTLTRLRAAVLDRD